MLTRSLALAGLVLTSLACAAGAQAARCGTASIYTVSLPGAPFSAIPTADEQTVFVSINATNPRQQNGIAVLTCVAGRYRLQRIIPLESQATVMAMTDDGRTLVVPDDAFIAFVDVARARSGKGDPLAGYIEDIPGDDGGAVYAAVSPDDRYAVVAQEQSGKLSVVDLHAARASHYAHSSIVSEFLIGNAPVATVFSRDGKYLFVTVQRALKRFNYAHNCQPEGGQPGDPDEAPGAVMVVDVAKMATDPDR